MVPYDPSKHFAEVWPERQDIGAPVPILRDPFLYSAIHYDIDYYRLSQESGILLKRSQHN
jgi:hypothetical protein